MHPLSGRLLRRAVVRLRQVWMVAGVAALIFCAGLRAQAPTIRVSVKLVQINCTAFDKKTGGEAKIDSPEQLRVYEDDKLQQIRLRRADELPLTLAVMIDTSSSQEEEWPRNKRQLHDFVKAVFRPGDRLFVASFALTIHPLMDMTATADNMDALLKKIDGLVKQAGPQVFPKPNAEPGTRVWDAMAVAAKVMSTLEGRKAVLMMTDGEDNASILTPAQVLHLAQDVSVPFFGIGVEGATLKSKMSGPFGHQRYGNHDPQALIDLVEGSGGKVFTDTADAAVAKDYTLLTQYLRSQFVVEYRVPEGSPGGFHKIRVEPVDKSVAVFAKKGVWRQ